MEKDIYLSFRYNPCILVSRNARTCLHWREILYVDDLLGTLSSQAIHDMASMMKDWGLRKWGFYDYRKDEPTK